MRTPYLIQRMKFRPESQIRGNTIDGVLEMDYMGSAEYEFGALPKSLKQICKNFNEFRIVQIKEIQNIQDKCLYMLTNLNDEQIKEYVKYIQKIIEGKHRLKEWININKHMVKSTTKNEYFGRPEDAWWDIDNHLMFCFVQASIEKIKKAIEATIEKKRSENQTEWYS